MKTILFALGILTLAAAPKKADPDPTKVDPKRLEKATIVLRVKKVAPKILEGGKYHWDTVAILHRYKNDSKVVLGKTMNVAHYGWASGVPAGESTIYLERYHPGHEKHWKLLGADGSKGVTHSGQVEPK